MVELLLLAPEDSVENVGDALIDELDALSVSVEDADADTEAEHALFGEPGMPPAYREPLRRRLQPVVPLPGPAAQRQLTLHRPIGAASHVGAAGALLPATEGAVAFATSG